MIRRLASYYPERGLRFYATGKLRADPIFAAAWERLRGSTLPLLDIGCGIGLLAFYLREKGFANPILGLDLDAEKIGFARQVAQGRYAEVEFAVKDVTELHKFQGNIVMMDVLHYLNPEKQHALLRQLARKIAPGGMCLIRATPRDTSWRFRTTQIEEWFIHACGWMKTGATHYLEAEEIMAPFREVGAVAETLPLWGRTPFNSHLFVFTRPA